MIIPASIYDDMIAHCRACFPNEACGILAGRDGEITAFYPMTNIEQSPVTYLMDSKEQFAVMKDMRAKGISMAAIFHSHPTSSAYPSGTDVNLAFYDDVVYVIVSLMDPSPSVRAFTIRQGAIGETELIVRGETP